jgi:predicted nucleic acid-binding protein
LKTIAIDASVVLKWYLDDETHGDAALSLLNRFVANEVDLVAPALLEYEVMSGLIIAQRRGRIPESTLIDAISAFQGLGIKLEGISGLGSRILFYAEKYARSAYDAAYLAVAEHVKGDFVTADKALHNSARKDLSWVKLLA